MKLRTGYTIEREMTRGGKENYDQSVIHPPGPLENYRKQLIRDLLQSREQQDGLAAVDGYFCSWIPAHEPIGGEPV
jgi:hypothetical protein